MNPLRPEAKNESVVIRGDVKYLSRGGKYYKYKGGQRTEIDQAEYEKARGPVSAGHLELGAKAQNKNSVAVTINGKKYSASVDGMTAKEVATKVQGMAKHSPGKALQWLKKNGTLVSTGKTPEKKPVKREVPDGWSHKVHWEPAWDKTMKEVSESVYDGEEPWAGSDGDDPDDAAIQTKVNVQGTVVPGPLDKEGTFEMGGTSFKITSKRKGKDLLLGIEGDDGVNADSNKKFTYRLTADALKSPEGMKKGLEEIYNQVEGDFGLKNVSKFAKNFFIGGED